MSDAARQFGRERDKMPSLAEIAQAWAWLGADIREVFPDLKQLAIGWGEPSCFRCGWLAPSKEAADYPSSWSAERAVDAAWKAAAGWLERAHLQDHIFGGDVDAWNLVPLCALCHEEQPDCETREAGVAFVNEGSSVPAPMQLGVQVFTDAFYRGVQRPGHARALRSLLRARAFIGEQIAKLRDEA